MERLEKLIGLREKLSRLDAMLKLLESTSGSLGTLTDLEDQSCSINWYGVEVGVLENYEDETYFVVEAKWNELFDEVYRLMELPSELLPLDII
jgi:hypothetical protein